MPFEVATAEEMCEAASNLRALAAVDGTATLSADDCEWYAKQLDELRLAYGVIDDIRGWLLRDATIAKRPDVTAEQVLSREADGTWFGGMAFVKQVQWIKGAPPGEPLDALPEDDEPVAPV